MKALLLFSLLLTCCGGSIEQRCAGYCDAGSPAVSETADASVNDAGIEVSQPDATSDAGCTCAYFEHTPSPTAVYVGPCGDYGLYDESAIVAPNKIFICSDLPQ